MTPLPSSPRARFGAYLYTQYFSAFNDNVHQMTVALYLAAESGAREGEGGKWQSLVQASFVLPFILFSSLAGTLADRYEKRTVLLFAKWTEVLPMTVSLVSTFLPSPWRYYGLILAVFLMETRSSFFSPAKYGILPEIVAPDALVRANGVVQMLTMVAIVSGEAIGGISFHRLGLRGAVLICLGIAVLGSMLTWWLPHGRPGDRLQRLQLDPFTPIWRTMADLKNNPVLNLTVYTLSAFWLISAIFRMNIPLFGRNELHLTPDRTSYLWALISIGIGAGAAIVSLIRGSDKSMGIVLPGALGMAAASCATRLWGTDFASSALILGLLGVFAGFYLVPQTTIFQARSPADRRGAYLGAQNFVNNVFMLVAAGIYYVLTGPLRCSYRNIFLVEAVGLLTLGVGQAILMPDLVLRGSRSLFLGLFSRKEVQA